MLTFKTAFVVLLLATGARAQNGDGHGKGDGHNHDKGHHKGDGHDHDKGHHKGDGHDHDKGHGKGEGHGHDETQALGAILPPYLRIQRALTTGNLTDIPKAAAALAKAAHTYHLAELAPLAEALKGASLADDRAAFRVLSESVVVEVLEHAAARKAYQVFDCAAAPGRWVQEGKVPKNPYQDGDLRSCGVAVEAPPEAPASAPVSAPASEH